MPAETNAGCECCFEMMSQSRKLLPYLQTCQFASSPPSLWPLNFEEDPSKRKQSKKGHLRHFFKSPNLMVSSYVWNKKSHLGAPSRTTPPPWPEIPLLQVSSSGLARGLAGPCSGSQSWGHLHGCFLNQPGSFLYLKTTQLGVKLDQEIIWSRWCWCRQK